MPKTANERLVDAYLRHALQIEGYTADQVRDVLRRLEAEVYPQVLSAVSIRLQLATDVSGVAVRSLAPSELKVLGDAVARAAAPGFERAFERLSLELQGFAVQESAWATSAMQRSVPNSLDISFLSPSETQVRAIATSRPFQGRHLSTWAESLTPDLRRRTLGAIQQGMLEGDSVDAIVRRIAGTKSSRYTDGVLQISRKNAEGIVRTAVGHVQGVAHEQTAKANASLLKGEKWVSTLDSRTSEICIALDGQVFAVGEGPRSQSAHFNCRGVRVPVTKSFRELGIDLDEFTPSTRASMDGQVPADLTYGEWLKRQPAEVQDAVLGPGKAALLRAGKIDARDLAFRRGRTVHARTLEELEALVAGREGA